MWYVYILECRDKTLYTGITKNIEQRLEQHNSGKASKYTRGRVPVKLVYKEKQLNQSSALKREVQIKQLTREKKFILIKPAV
ncbi:MAG: GIY-YIG nuclease family protein [Candidatus Omnitrophota bacterium]